jgi:DNA polymerase-3 subunit gamma/tau
MAAMPSTPAPETPTPETPVPSTPAPDTSAFGTSAPSLPITHRALYRRWRAQTFGQIVGQPAVVETLRNAVRLDRLSHGFLFVGPRGTGKTSMARILAKAINCPNVVDGEPCDACPSCDAIREGRALDVIELDAASNNRVDDMRELLPRVYTAASDLRHKVFIVDEVQRIKEGWDVLLKTLEEPPDGVLFIFCTTNPSGIRPAVVSRLQRFLFRPLAVDEIGGKLRRILDADGRQADDDAVELVARLAAGGMRDAESMLEQLLSAGGDRLTADGVRDLLGLADATAVDRVVDALVTSDALAGLAVLDALEAEGRDLVSFADQLVERLRAIVVERLAGRPGPTPATATVPVATLAAAARRLTGLDANRSTAGGFRFQLELVLLQGAAGGASPEAAAALPPFVDVVRPDVVRPEPARPEPARSDPRPGSPPPEPVEPPEPASATGAGETPEPAAPERPTPAPESPTDDLLAAVRRGWPEVVAHVSRNPANRPLIAACRPVEVADGIVVLGFPEHQPFLREKAEQRRSALEEGLAVVLGRPVGIRCVIANLEALAEADGDPAADDEIVSQARRIFAGDVADVAEID